MIHKVEADLGGGRTLSFETGKIAKEANGSVVVRMADTVVLAAAVASSSPREGIDFFPLLVDFEEKLYAVGKIPGGFFKREGRPTEQAILTARRIDRPIRPLFSEGFRNDVQIAVTPLSVDLENPPDVLAINAASAALTISDIPFEGPIGAARAAKVDGKIIIDPTMQEMEKSSMDVVVAGTKDKILMIEAGADQISEEEILEAIAEAHKAIKKVIALQEELAQKAGLPKRVFAVYAPDESIVALVQGENSKIKEALKILDKDKRKETINKIEEDLLKKISSASDAEAAKKKKDLKSAMEEMQKKIMRRMILDEGKRVDGRGLGDLREINCEVGVLPRAHGSAIFSRGQTQVLTVATLGAAGDEQIIDGLNVEEQTKRYMHHYNFPAFSVGEVRPMRGPGRREIGHGALAERALVPVIPDSEKFPYTVRLVSEVLGSNGSTSMASTCGSTLALMDAGVKIESPVAGISIGLIEEKDKTVTLIDIQGLEDHFGDMDFKVAGTTKGITAIQVDVKVKGLSFDLVKKALSEAKQTRLKILDIMQKAIAAPRTELSPYAPKVITLNIDPEKIGMVIGPGGKNIKKIIEETGTQIDIEDSGQVFITGTNAEGLEQARKIIDDMTYEVKPGDVFKQRVVRIMAFGAFVELPGGKDGLVHISQISNKRVAKVEDEINIGDEVIVKVMEIDDMGRINLSMKAVSPQERAKFQ